MQKLPKQKNKKVARRQLVAVYVILPLVVVSLFAYAIVKRIIYLAADPKGAKDCPPLNPQELSDSNSLQLVPMQFKQLLPFVQLGGTINDASCLDKTSVYGIVKVKNEDDIKRSLLFAKEHNLKVSLAGVRHSMGGQAFAKHALVLDMTGYNQVQLDENEKTITVQSGATWHQIQSFLHPKYAVKAMQSTDIFTVGGSISVNAHGMDHTIGSVSNTLRSLRLMHPDGTIETLNASQNPQLYNLVIGGYGLFGVILDAKLDITDNTVYQAGQQVVNYKDFPEIFTKQILPDKKLGLFYGHLSTAPSSFLQEMILYTYKETDGPHGSVGPLTDVGSVKLRRFVINLSKYGSFAREIKWYSEKHIEPKLESCTVGRSQAMKDGEACLVSRNDPMHDSVPYLRNDHKDETDILHEYFIPRDKFIPFVDGMRQIFLKHNTNLLNASVRVVHKEDNMLTYAPEDMFSLVLYINQKTDPSGNEEMKQTTQELIDLTTSMGGRFFLPYQLYYTSEQLQKSYPMIADFFGAKKQYDPEGLLTSTFYETYKP